LADFIGMIGQARAFVIDTEIIAGEMISPLRALLTSQVSTTHYDLLAQA
jgi:hypothetical protein